MKVCVCGGTNPAINPQWMGFATPLGKMLCENDFDMVWGGNAFGALSKIHQEYIKDDDGKQHDTLFLPNAYKDDLLHMQTDRIVRTELVVERTHQMFLAADVVVVVPGGIGTIYEFWSAVEGKRAGEYKFDIILLNYNGFFNSQLEFFDFINKNGFTKVGVGGAPYKIQPYDLFIPVSTPEDVIFHLKKIAPKFTRKPRNR